MKIKNESGATDVCISINDVPDLKFLKNKYIGLQAWYESETCYKIEIILKKGKILTEYNSLEKWKTILKLIHEEL